MSKGLMGVNRRRYSATQSPGIDLERKWAAGAILYDAEDNHIMLVRVVLPGKDTIAMVEIDGDVRLITVHPPGEPGVFVWDYIGNVGGTVE